MLGGLFGLPAAQMANGLFLGLAVTSIGVEILVAIGTRFLPVFAGSDMGVFIFVRLS